MRPGKNELTDSWSVHPTRCDGLVQVNVTVANFDIKAATGVYADPSLVMHGRTLAAVVR